jgi:16S rRNA (uracil1498-N3)-methyltransferase
MPSTAAEAAGEPARPPVFLACREDLAGDVIVLSGPEGRHAATVRRLAPGERVDVADGEGQVAECVVTGARGGTLELAVLARREEPPPSPAIVVVQAIPKGDRGQLAVEMLTEAGADEVVPWQAERCVARWRDERGLRSLERWRAAAREAAKQARRARVPRVAAAERTDEVARRVAAASLAVLLTPEAPGSLADTPLPSGGELMVIVGPEGGVSAAEEWSLTAAGARPARLGPAVLRTSTAGVVAVSVLLSRLGWRERPG